jgi:SAM-dependent methyltransferase
MTVQVLQSTAAIVAARRALRQRGLSSISPLAELRRRLARRGWRTGVIVGDMIKSWDIAQTARFIEEALPRDAAILDMGAFQSEILIVLRKLGYSRLTGLDLNPAILQMPHAGDVRYQVADFLDAPFPAGAFAAITAISVIEHGYEPERLLREVSRLLAPGGYFIASFDYWPEKLDTLHTRIFDMSWTIFSREDVQALLTQAATYGLLPTGQISLAAGQPIVDMFGRQYTFAWLALRKGATT